MNSRGVCSFLVFLFLGLTGALSTAPSPSPSASTTPGSQIDPKLFSGMQWRQVGPFRGGRALAIEGVPGEPNTWYFGAVAGGVWKTVDGGANWTPLFDKQDISSIGAIAVAPSDHNTIYVGTGEAAIRGNTTYGTGVYKSVDGGKNWKNIGLRDTHQIGALIVHPNNPDIVLVAALGHAFGPNAERGIFRTSDGGKTWTKVLSKDENTGGIDVVFDPHNPNVVFASLWQARRQPWFFSSGGPGSGLYKSEDNGVTWKQLTGNGLPDGILGIIGISVSGADSNRVVAIIEAKEGGIFRSDDGGEKWTKVNDDGRFRQRAWYFSKIYADPKSADTVYVLNTGAFYSVDGAQTFDRLPARHGDHHGLWIDPQNPNRIGNANDGGASISMDGGKTWTTQNNQPTAQFYHVATDNAYPYHIYGAQQDNSDVGIASRSEEGVITAQDWFVAGGGECGFVIPDPRDWHIIYSNSEGYIVRYDKNKEEGQDVSVWPMDHSGHGAVDLLHRFQCVTPLLPSPHDATTAYVAVDRHRLDDFKPYIFKTTDLGKSWSTITNGIPDGAYVRSVREDPKRKGLLYAGTELGVYFSLDEGAHWQPLQLNLPQSPIHDLVVKDDDLVAATHGRSFWVLDNLTPLRQLTTQNASSDMLLYQPQSAVRLHYPEEIDKRQPAGDNPPMGAMIDYYFKSQ